MTAFDGSSLGDSLSLVALTINLLGVERYCNVQRACIHDEAAQAQTGKNFVAVLVRLRLMTFI